MTTASTVELLDRSQTIAAVRVAVVTVVLVLVLAVTALAATFIASQWHDRIAGPTSAGAVAISGPAVGVMPATAAPAAARREAS